MSTATTPTRTRGRRIVLILAALVAVIALIAAGGTVAYAKQFTGKALPGTTVMGVDVAGKNEEQIARLLADRGTGVTVTVDTDGAAREVSLEDLGIRLDPAASAKNAVSGSSSFVDTVAAALSGERPVAPVLSFDPNRAESFAKSLVPADQVAAVDASLAYDESAREFTVTPARNGTGVNPAEFVAELEKHAPELTDFTVKQEFSPITPVLTTQKAEAAQAKANALLQNPMSVKGPNGQKFTVTKADRSRLITVKPTAAGDDFEVSVNKSEAEAYVKAMTKDIDVAPKNGVEGVMEDGSTKMLTQKVDGLKVTNADAVAAEFAAALAEGKEFSAEFETETVTAEVKKTEIKKDDSSDKKTGLPATAPEEATTGGKWIDINLTNKTITAYQGDQVVYGPIKMVDGKPEYETVTGTYETYLRYDKQDMTNEPRYPKGHPKHYYTKDVPYVQYFHRGYAIHGAPWRSSFGFSGSHGCVNLPVADAKWFYDWAPMGTTVSSHY